MRYCVEKQSLACMAWVTHCYGQLEDSLNLCNTDDQLILKNRILDMLDRVKFLLDKKYEQDPKGNADNPKIIKGVKVMKHEFDDARRHAENTISAVNRALDRTRDPKQRYMLTDMHEKATRTLENLRRISDDRPDYRTTSIGYRDDIIPYLDDDDMDDIVDRRGRGRARVRVRADMDDDMDNIPVDQPRWRSRRTGRFLPNLYGPRRVRRVRRADLYDDRYDDDLMDDRYTDDLMDDHMDTIRKTAARTAADTAKYMKDDDRGRIYPTYMPPVMPRQDDRTDDTTHTPAARTR